MQKLDRASNDPATDLSSRELASTADVPMPAGAGTPAVMLPSRRARSLPVPQWLGLLLGNWKSAMGLFFLVVIVLIAVFAPLITPYNPTDMVATPSQPPSFPDHWFGTTHQGQDIFAQVLWGARVSLTIGAAAALLSTLISAALGMIAAYVGGWVDELLNLVTNIFLIIPALPLLIVISAYLPFKNALSMILIIAFTTWAGEARVLRSQALSLRSRDFILAALASGESTMRIVFGEIMPNMVSRIAAGFLGAFVGAVLFEAGLEFLGFGNSDTVSWGTTLFWAQNNGTLLTGEWWHFTFPGLALALTATALIFLNDGLDEISNPRLRAIKMPKKLPVRPITSTSTVSR
ncbi:MAG: hypothetical protein NVSMB65_21470 [Chloroflexota bacterium]